MHKERLKKIIAMVLSFSMLWGMCSTDTIFAWEDIPTGARGYELLQELREMGLGQDRTTSGSIQVTPPGVTTPSSIWVYQDETPIDIDIDIEQTTSGGIEVLPPNDGTNTYDEEKLIVYVQSLSGYQVISLEETDITEIENDDLYSMLTDEQLEQIEKLKAPIHSVTEAGPLMPPVSLGEIEQMYPVTRMMSLEDNFKEPPPGLNVSKSASWDEEKRSATIRLESYTTGTVTEETVRKPVDIVLVLDQSGSMDYSFGEITQVLTLPELNKEKSYTWEGKTIEYNTWWKVWRYKEGNSWVEVPQDAEIITTKKSATRREALIEAAKKFVKSVRADAIKDSEKIVDHRIAMVGFASAGKSSNTGLFVGSEFYKYGGSDINNKYQEAFQRMDQDAGVTNIRNSILQLKASGATSTHLGMEMATKIFEKDNYSGEYEERNRVVILFTDGEPTTSNIFDDGVANGAIGYAEQLKATEAFEDTSKQYYGSTVYTIGIMPGANPTSVDENDKPNKFMNLVSSNYPKAEDMSTKLNADNNAKNYYLAAKNQEELNKIFESISNNIERPTYSLDETTILKDIISDYFVLDVAEGKESVKVYTQNFIGGTVEKPEWGSEEEITHSVDIKPVGNEVSKEISVTGYNYDANFLRVLEGQRKGKKLVVELKVKPIPGFVGGNGVPTNGDTAGIYRNNGDLVANFKSPKVNVGLQYNFVPKDQSIYITNTVENPADFILSYETNGDIKKSYIEYMIQDVSNDLTSYRLGEKHNDFAVITYTVKDQANNTVGTYKVSAGSSEGSWIPNSNYGAPRWVEEPIYRISCTVTPFITSVNGTTVPNHNVGPKEAKVYLYTPEIRNQDKSMYLGTELPSDERAGVVELVGWDYRGTDTNVPSVSGEPPVLSYSYILTKTNLPNTDWWLEQDTDFNVQVKSNDIDISSKTLIHPAGKSQDNHHFTVEVKTCTLTVRKEAASQTIISDSDNFIFDITRKKGSDTEPTKINNKYGKMQVVISGTGEVTITGLPVGTYTITENENWSWRYKSDAPKTVTLSKGSNCDNKTVKITNRKDSNKWITFETIVRNIYQPIGN